MPSLVLRSILSATLTGALVVGLGVAAGCRWPGEGGASGIVRLVDEAGILSAMQKASIEHYLEFIDTDRGVDYRVVVIDSAGTDLVGEGVTRYQQMGVGRRTEGKGLLLLINVGAREARVEVGYDLEHRVRDVEASSMIRDLLAPYFAGGEAAMGIEASVERLVEVLEPTRNDVATGPPLSRSGGAGATALLAGIEELTPAAEARLAEIMVPQAKPEDCVHLEMALMHKGIYYNDVPMYDEAWRRSLRPGMPARRLKALAAKFDGPFEIVRSGDHAISAYRGENAELWGPRFLRRTAGGWIIDGTAAAENIIYDYSNRWVAVDGDYPYLPLIHRAYEMRPGTLRSRGAAWIMVP